MNAADIEHIHNLAVPAVLDTKGKWCFIKNPKVATHTIETCGLGDRTIVRRDDPERWEAAWKRMYAPRMEDVVVFTFVRNPWDRVLSAFMFCQQLRRRGSAHNKIDRRMTFRYWVINVLAVQGPSVNEHFAEQAKLFMRNGTRIPEIFVGRYERLDEDWRIFADRLGLSNTLPERLNTSLHEHYTHYYDDDTRGIVRQLYAEEIEALGYEYREEGQLV